MLTQICKIRSEIWGRIRKKLAVQKPTTFRRYLIANNSETKQLRYRQIDKALHTAILPQAHMYFVKFGLDGTPSLVAS